MIQISVTTVCDCNCIKYKFHCLLFRPQITTYKQQRHILICPITSLLSKSVCDWSPCICYSVCGQTAKCVVVLPPRLPVINPCDILQKWIIYRGLSNKNKGTAKKKCYNAGREIGYD